MASFGLSCLCTLETVCRSCSRPLADRYCACTGMSTLSDAASALTVSIPSEGIQSMRMWLYCRFTPSSTCRSTVSRLMAFTRDTSMPDSSMLAGSTSTPSAWWSIASSARIGSSMSARLMSVDSVTGSASGWGQPRLMVRLACGSASPRSTRLPSCASPMPRLAQVVVLPTPPFWFAIDRMVGCKKVTSKALVVSKVNPASEVQCFTGWVRLLIFVVTD